MIRSQNENTKENGPLSISRKAVIAIVVIGLCIAASVVGFFVLGFGRSPLDKVEDAVSRTAGALAKRSEVLNFVYSLPGAESPGVSISAENIGEMIGDITGDPEVSSYLDADLVIDSAVDTKGNSFVSAKISSNGEDAVAGLYKTASGDADAAFVVPWISDEVYGFSINTMKKDMESSILAPDSGSVYALDADDFEQIEEAVDVIQTFNQFISADDLIELASVIKESDGTKVEFKTGKENITVGGEQLRANVYKGTLTTKALKGSLDVAARWLDRYYKLSILDMTFEEAAANLTDDILENELELKLEFDVYNGYLVRLCGSIEPFEFSVDFGPDPEKTEVISAVVSRDGDEVFYDIDISGLEKNEISVSSGSGNDAGIMAKFSYDDSENSFRIQYDTADSSAVMAGEMTLADGTLSLTDPVITAGDLTMDLKGLSARITDNAAAKKLTEDFPEGYTNIFTVTEDDADSVMKKIGEAGQMMYEVIEVDFYNILLSIGDALRG